MLAKKLLTILFFTVLSVSAYAQPYDLIVAADGSGNYTTVQAAINAVATGLTAPYKIFIKNGKYREKINVPSSKPFIQLIGQSVAGTILYYDDASANAGGTSASASFTISANDFSAFNITFVNSYDYDAGVAAGVSGTQAVAIVISGDRSAFKNCRFQGNQDTVYSNKKAYFKNCYIDGIVDFIFGGGANIFDSCTIYPKTRTNGGSSYITAANTPIGQTYGYVFRDSKIISNPGNTMYVLGRPWQNSGTGPYAENKVVLINTVLNSNISAAGWSTWDAGTQTSSITYAEYQSKFFIGSPVDVSGRVAWSQQLNSSQVANYTNANILGGWDPCAVYSGMCSAGPTDIAVSNFIGTKGVGTASFKWNLSWGISTVKFEIFRSLIRSGTYTKIGEVTSANDTTYNHNFIDGSFPAGQVYYYLLASKAGLASHNTDTIMLSTKPTISVNAALGSFQQGGGLPSASQTYTVNGVNLTDNVIITPPTSYEISTNNTSWVTSSNSITLVQTSGVLANTTIYARQNAATAPGTFSGNILHTTVNGDNVLVAVNGTTQVAALTPAAFYRSRISGNLNDLTTWETSTDSTTWYAASTFPTGAAEENITIMPGHTVTVNVLHTVNGKWTVYGTGSNVGGALTLTSPLTFANNSNLVWNRDGGTLPATTVFSSGSTFSIIGIGNGNSYSSATFSSIPVISPTTVFHNVIINSPNCTSNPNFAGNLRTINGNLIILSTGIYGTKMRFTNSATAVINIGGDLIVNPPKGKHAYFVLYSTATVAGGESVNVGGNLLVNNSFPTNITGITGAFTIGTNTITLSTANPNITVGMGVTGTGIASNSNVTAISGTTLTLNVNTTATSTINALTFVQSMVWFYLTDGGGLGSQTYINGNVTVNTATMGIGSNLATLNISRTDGVQQNYTNNSGSIGGMAWNIMANAVFDVGTSILPGGSFTLNAGATLRSASATGLANITATTKSFSSAANYIYNGTVAQTTLNNFTSTTPTANQVNNLTINNAAGVTLGNVLIVANATTLTNGKLTLGAANLITNSITGSSNSYVVTNAAGFLKVKNVGAVSTLFPVGISASSYTPVTMSNSGTADTFSVRIIAAAPQGIHTSPRLDSSLNLTWDIAEDVAGGSNVAITMQWNVANQNSLFNINNCAVVHSNGTAIDYTGMYAAATNPSTGVYSVTGTGFTSFSPYGVTSKPGSSSVLPLTLLSYTALKEKKNVRLDWTTSNEINTKKFLVERATDLLKFDAIKDINANGILTFNNYKSLDENPLKGLSYYRLKIIENNGQFSYSKIAKVFFADTKAMFVSPNPVVNSINVEHAAAGKDASFTIYTIDGKKLTTYTPATFATFTSFNVNLLSGTYILCYANNGTLERSVIVKK